MTWFLYELKSKLITSTKSHNESNWRKKSKEYNTKYNWANYHTKQMSKMHPQLIEWYRISALTAEIIKNNKDVKPNAYDNDSDDEL